MDVLTRLGPALADRDRIERELGQGGMATVYLADDIRHGRKVAIKLLHAELSAVLGPERFLAEIRTTAGLQHPHVLPLFDSGSADGLLYYVMPYVEGETLRRRLERERQLPVGDAVRLASEVADALDYAHGHGIVHRDIKPENILLQGGHALVADFGIALAVQQAGGSRMTQTGLSLGTPQYMAPEQATGERQIDARADVYALGAVAYEMLAGVPPFTGPSAQAIVAKVLTERPRSLTELRDTVPPHVAAAIGAALEKLPADRPASAREFARMLSDEGRQTAATRRGFAGAPVRRLQWAGGGFAVLAAATVGYAAGHRAPSAGAPTPPPSRLALLSPALGGTGIAGIHRQLTLTPDGAALVYVVQAADGQNALAYQRLDAAEPAAISGGERLLDPQISPDGRWVIGWGIEVAGGAPEQAYRIHVGGGTPVRLPPEVDPRFAAWGTDGSFWFTATGSGPLQRLSPDGKLAPVFPERTAGLRLQQLLGSGRSALMVRTPLGNASGPCVVLDLESGQVTTVLDAPVVEARYTAGLLVYVRGDGALVATPFDAKSQRTTGPPVQVATGVSLTGTNIAQLAAAPNGTVAYLHQETSSLVLADRAGGFRPATTERRNYHAPQFSPDGRRISVDFSGGDGRDVWLLTLREGTLSRATFVRDGHDAVWSPDGQFLTYTSFRSGVLGLYRVRAGSGAPPESLFASAALGYTGSWLPDGSALLTTGQDLQPGSGPDIALVVNGGHGPVEPVIADPFFTAYPVPSPDGRWFAFASNQSGQQQVFVRTLAPGGEVVQVSQDGGTEPVWSRDGRELYYRGNNGGRAGLIAAEIRRDPEPEVVSRRFLFPVDEISGASPHANYAVSPDGKTFVVVQRGPANRIVVLQNLPELVRRLGEAGPAGR
jgi:serine/threonine-protein kinase